jgi:hypothetical protein
LINSSRASTTRFSVKKRLHADIVDKKKAGVVEDPQVHDHTGLLSDGPPE